MVSGRVIGTEAIESARRRGRIVLELLPGDIVTALARETAERIGLRFVEGPLRMPVPPRTEGAVSMRRVLYRRSPKWRTPRRVPREVPALGRLAIVGVGGVGGNIAQLAATRNVAREIALVDITPGLATATAMDLNHASGITGVAVQCTGGERLEGIAGADVVVVTAGRARTPGMGRSDLVDVNSRVVRRVAEAIRTEAHAAIVVVVTNPLDEMTLETLRATGFPRERVLGMAGTLDSARFRNALARAANVPPGDVDAIVLGSHGDEMVPVCSRARIKGRPLRVFLSRTQIAACCRDAVTGGGQVVAVRRTGSATIAPAHAVVEVIDHVRGARTGLVPVSVMLEGEYGISGVVLGVPALLGPGGLLGVEQVPLSPEETAALQAAAESIRGRMDS